MFSRGLFLSHADVFGVTQISQMTQIFDLFGLGFRRWTQLLLPFYLFTFLPFYFFTFISVWNFADFYYLCSMNRKRIKKKFTNLGQRMLRMPRTRGFGVQSPTAYSFLRKVVNEKGFLRNYRQIHSDFSSYPQDDSKQKRLLFRIRTVYPHVVELSASSLLQNEDFQQFLRNVSADTVLVVIDINLDAEYRKVWMRLVADDRTVLTFNLVDCGIVFFDKTKFKQNFNVNY